MAKRVIWDQEEEEIIINNYSVCTIKELVLLLYNKKTYKQVKNKLFQMELKCVNEVERNIQEELASWNIEEDNFIKNNYKLLKINEISEYLKKDYFVVRRRYKFLDLKRPHDSELSKNRFLNKFSNEDIQLIKDNVDKKSLGEIAILLSKEFNDINRLCSLLDIQFKTRKQLFNENTQDIDRVIKVLHAKFTTREIANILELNYQFVIRRCFSLNINCADGVEYADEARTKILNEVQQLVEKIKISEFHKKNKSPNIISYRSFKDTSAITNKQASYIVENYKAKTILDFHNELNKNPRNIVLKMILLGLFKPLENGNTSMLENVVAKILYENNIHFISQKKMYDKNKNKDKYIVPDFFIKNDRKIIEVYGDLWHQCEGIESNDDLFFEIKDDKSRETIIKENGYKLLIVWENEIVNNFEETYNNIIKFILNDEISTSAQHP